MLLSWENVRNFFDATGLLVRDYMGQPAQDAAPITPSDSVSLTVPARAIYVGTAGDVTLVTQAGNTVLFPAVQQGVLPVAAKQVKATGTTASGLVALL